MFDTLVAFLKVLAEKAGGAQGVRVKKVNGKLSICVKRFHSDKSLLFF